jgi:hypothetical protein
MSESVRVANTPYAVLVESAKTYFWRSRGQSKNNHFVLDLKVVQISRQ